MIYFDSLVVWIFAVVDLPAAEMILKIWFEMVPSIRQVHVLAGPWLGFFEDGSSLNTMRLGFPALAWRLFKTSDLPSWPQLCGLTRW
jgi:hypothetical protein